MNLIEKLKELGVNVTGLRTYKEMYGTTPNTVGYKDSSMWAFSYSRVTGCIEVNVTYFESTPQLKEYNFFCEKQYWTKRIKSLKIETLPENEKSAIMGLIEKYNIK